MIKLADEAIEASRALEGFRDWPDGFSVEPIVVDERRFPAGFDIGADRVLVPNDRSARLCRRCWSCSASSSRSARLGGTRMKESALPIIAIVAGLTVMLAAASLIVHAIRALF